MLLLTHISTEVYTENSSDKSPSSFPSACMPIALLVVVTYYFLPLLLLLLMMMMMITVVENEIKSERRGEENVS
jgi:hypothetical protein